MGWDFVTVFGGLKTRLLWLLAPYVGRRERPASGGSRIPAHMLEKRRVVSKRYIHGKGIEAGALDEPLWTSELATVQYIDRYGTEELRRRYPELKDATLVTVDRVDDAETLTTVADRSLDFIIGNHMLEHCENPLGTIRTHLSKIHDGGIIYYAVPDKRHCFDSERHLTTFDHLVRDDREGGEVSRLSHFREWSRYVQKCETPEAIEAHVQKIIAVNYSIHFHVWDHDAFRDFIFRAEEYLQHAFRIEYFDQNDTEVIVVLRKVSA
jgi:2-polyprenyl-3-methyl-5-hydroxy-6-metoxy-1,4-benzoquinol methylase